MCCGHFDTQKGRVRKGLAALYRETVCRKLMSNQVVEICFDCSSSMKDLLNGRCGLRQESERRVNCAKEMVEAFVVGSGSETPFGLISFNDDVRGVDIKVDNWQAIKRHLAERELAEGTRLYEAISAAVHRIKAYIDRNGFHGKARIVVLSDGRDEGSVTGLRDLGSQLKQVKIILDCLVISTIDPSDLETLCAETGGQFHRVTSKQDGINFVTRRDFLDVRLRTN